MTTYRPAMEPGNEPRYIALANAIARDIEGGALAAGNRLPTHRELARSLGVSIGTVTRAYREAERRGLIVGEVGRGTFVSGSEAGGWAIGSGRSDVIDLSLALPWTTPAGDEGRLLAETLQAILRRSDVTELLQHPSRSASMSHRAKAAAWLARAGVPARPETVVITAGAQHAITVTLSALLRSGDSLAVEELTYPGVKPAAQMLGVHLRGVALDDEGMVPDDLDRICRDGSVRALYCVPTAQNPTGATMSEQRRQQLITVARNHDVLILEDDVYGGLDQARHSPLAKLAPERTVHVSTLSKTMAFGLRTAFVYAPEPLVDRLIRGVRGTLWVVPPLMVEITLRWLTDDRALALARVKREEMATRQVLATETLDGCCKVMSAPYSIHAWLELPEPWRSDELVLQARQRGVLVAGAEAFLVGRARVPCAARIALGRPSTREELRRGLGVLREILTGEAGPAAAIV